MNLEIYDTTDSIYVEKDNRTKVNYYIFDEYEIHLNTLPPHAIQEWHRHQKIEEVIFVISGKLKILWKEEDQNVRFLVYRMVPDGIDKKNIIKNDKELMI